MQLLEFLQSSTIALNTTVTITGMMVGSFLNVVIYRLPLMMQKGWRQECCEFLEIDNEKEQDDEAFNLVTPRSRCPNCQHAIKAWENIPVISYLVLRGRCSSCQQSISLRYPSIEALTGLLSLVVVLHFSYSPQLIPALLLTWALVALSFIDFDHQLLPDDITLPFLWLGLLCNLFGLFTDIYSSVIGAIAGYMILWLIYITFKILTGKEGMGHGDFKLLSLLGAWMGWEVLPLTIILSSLCGALVGISLIMFTSHDRRTAIPFGPYLSMAGWIALIWGAEIMAGYDKWLMP